MPRAKPSAAKRPPGRPTEGTTAHRVAAFVSPAPTIPTVAVKPPAPAAARPAPVSAPKQPVAATPVAKPVLKLAPKPVAKAPVPAAPASPPGGNQLPQGTNAYRAAIMELMRQKHAKLTTHAAEEILKILISL